MKKLAIVSTHPIQYFAPLFRLLTERGVIDIKAFYTWSQAQEKVKDKVFGKEIKWDIPLLEGYQYEFVKNISKNPGSNSWKGINNPELISKIKAYDPNAVLVFGWKMKSHFQTMRYFKGKIPVWFRGDSTLLDEKNGVKTLLRRQCLKYIYSYINKALYVGEQNKKYFKAHGLSEDQLIFAPHAIDNERFYDSSNGRYKIRATAWRKELGYSKDDLVVLFSGKFEKKKNPVLLIKAIQQVNAATEANIKLLLIGNGPLEREVRDMIHGDHNILMLPFQNQSQMPIVYRLGDIFCLPSQGPGETWGLAINEAMACSRPVIVSDKVGCAEDLVSHKVGYTFTSGNLDELKKILKKLQKADLDQLGNNARNKIQDWNFSRICEALEKCLKQKELG